LRSSRGPHNRERGRFAGEQLTHLLGERNQILDIGRRAVGGDVSRLVAEESLAILELHPRSPQSVAEGVLQIVHPDKPKTSRTRQTEFLPAPMVSSMT
jgi:hypothetical protein